jgi:hypothetical protein
MASPPSLVQISFAGGIDESMTDEVLDPSQAFRVLENTRQDYQGGANKRLGFAPQSRSRLSGSRDVPRAAGCGRHVRDARLL